MLFSARPSNSAESRTVWPSATRRSWISSTPWSWSCACSIASATARGRTRAIAASIRSFNPMSVVTRTIDVTLNSGTVICLPPGTRTWSSTRTSPGLISKACADSGTGTVIFRSLIAICGGWYCAPGAKSATSRSNPRRSRVSIAAARMEGCGAGSFLGGGVRGREPTSGAM